MKILMLLVIAFVLLVPFGYCTEYLYTEQGNKGILTGGVEFRKIKYACDYLKPGDKLLIAPGEYDITEQPLKLKFGAIEGILGKNNERPQFNFADADKDGIVMSEKTKIKNMVIKMAEE